MTKKAKIIIGVVSIVLVVFVIAVKYADSLVKKDHKVSVGTVTKCAWGGRGTARYVITVSFTIGMHKYETTRQLKSCTKTNLNELNNKLLNTKVLVVYYTKFPELSTVLLEREDYNIYNIEMPDSLVWIHRLVMCD